MMLPFRWRRFPQAFEGPRWELVTPAGAIVGTVATTPGWEGRVFSGHVKGVGSRFTGNYRNSRRARKDVAEQALECMQTWAADALRGRR